MFDSSDYQSPQWQKKRLEVMELANWKCECCTTESRQLHVHHITYSKDKRLWDYDNTNFKCVCDDCHEKMHRAIESFRSAIAQSSNPYRLNCFDDMSKAINSMPIEHAGKAIFGAWSIVTTAAAAFRKEDHHV